MAKPYKILGRSPDWSLVETPTNQIVATFCDSRPAKKLANFLNGGNGFNGWTPSFILE